MGKVAVLPLILILFLAIGGCASHPVSSESPAKPKAANTNTLLVDYKSVHIIQLASDKTVLIDGTYFEITPASTFTAASGDVLRPKELNPGDLIFLTASKKTSGQFPGKGILLSLTRHEDETSQLISQAIRHVMENQKIGDIIAPELKSVSSHLITLQFKDWANEHKYECIVNMNSLAFHIKEISNSTKK